MIIDNKLYSMISVIKSSTFNYRNVTCHPSKENYKSCVEVLINKLYFNIFGCVFSNLAKSGFLLIVVFPLSAIVERIFWAEDIQLNDRI